jgi:hypothetical protein
MRVMFLPRTLSLFALLFAALTMSTALAQQAVVSGVTPADQIVVPTAPVATMAAGTAEPTGVTPAKDGSANLAQTAGQKDEGTGILAPFKNSELLNGGKTASQETASVNTGKGEVPGPASLVLPMRGPDLEALRYYAKNGEHDRYRREYQRIQALYPGWIAPRDLFADNSAQEQELWDMYGKNEIAAIERRIAEMRAADPGWQPSQVLLDTMVQRQTRGDVAALVEAKDWPGVLAKIDAQPGLINGQDVELLWFAGTAFSETGNKAAAIDAYRAALSVSENASLKAATLQKAAVYLTAEDLEAFVNEMMTYVTAADDIGVLEDGLIRGLLEASLRTGQPLPERFDERLRMLMERAVATNNQVDIELLAWSAFQIEDWEQSNRWFEMMPEENQDPEVLEGKVLSLKHKGDWLTAFRKSQEWRNLSEDLGRIYINLGAPYMLPQRPEKFEPQFLAEYASKTLELQRGEGAEALGWYAYNIRQLKTAHEWFLQAVQWDETDTGAYGLVLTARAARDLELFSEYKRIYGPVYPLIAETEFSPCGNDTPIETIYYETDDYREWRETLEERFQTEGRLEDQECLDSIENRRLNEQNLVERLEGSDRPIAPWEVERTDEERYQERRALREEQRRERMIAQGLDPDEQYRNVEPRARNRRVDDSRSRDMRYDEQVYDDQRYEDARPQRRQQRDAVQSRPIRRDIQQTDDRQVASVPRQRQVVEKVSTNPKPRATGGNPGGGGSSSLAQMQSKKDYIGCLKLSSQLIASGRAKAKDYETRGWCLMGANRPTEAEQAFEKSRKMGGGSAAGYGESLASLRNGKTNDAMNAAMNTNMSAEKRRELDVEMLTQRAIAAYAAKDYQSTLYALDERKKRKTEGRDLMMMRAWSLFHLGFKREANGLMKAIDRQLSTADSRRGVSATGRLN